jgi:hypothetical protein
MADILCQKRKHFRSDKVILTLLFDLKNRTRKPELRIGANAKELLFSWLAHRDAH